MSIIRLYRNVCHWSAVCGLLAAVIILAGCHSSSPRPAMTGSMGAAAAPPTNPENEVIQPGQKVTVAFSDLPSPVQPYDLMVKEDGSVTLLLNQTFTFAGKTRGVLEKEIRDRYVPRFYKYMTVTINYGIATQFYYVDGEVRVPARQTYIDRTTVLKAIASAGGFTDFAKKTAVTLTRVDGRKYTINCKKARVDPKLDLEVYPGDKIWVPRKLF